MWSKKLSIIALAMTMAFGVLVTDTMAQGSFDDQRVVFSRRNLGGPRIGLTFVAGNNDLWRELDRRSMGRMMSQFGWHFEYQVIPEGGGPQFVVELVPLVAGVEYGKFVPSATLAMGVRFPNGIEFGLGPNVMAIGSSGGDLPTEPRDKGKLKTALVMALGKSFNYGGVSIPLNLVCTTNPGGTRFSIIFGYAIAKSR
jgi:hypothetical protein